MATRPAETLNRDDMPRRFRRRFTILDAFDEAMLSFALKDEFSSALFVDNAPMVHRAIGTHDTLADISYPPPSVWFVPPGWEPEFFPAESCSGIATRFMVVNSPRYVLHLARSDWCWGYRGIDPAKWSFSFPTIENGWVAMRHDPNSPADKAFLSRVWKVLGRVMTNRLKNGLNRDRFVSARGRKGSGGEWAGFHILEWCRQDPRRMLNGAYLPCDDWEPPDTPYIRDLRARVIARYGPDFGRPVATGRLR